MESIGSLCLPSDMVGAALSFLGGRSLTVFETANKGARQAVQEHPDIYKALLVRFLLEPYPSSPVASAVPCCLVLQIGQSTKYFHAWFGFEVRLSTV